MQKFNITNLVISRIRQQCVYEISLYSRDYFPGFDCGGSNHWYSM